MQVDFYHLAASPLESVLARIAGRLIADGGRLLVVADDDALLARLDGALWTHAADSFLPHERSGAGRDPLQPVLLSRDIVASNDARNVALVDGLWRDDALAFDRAFHFFDDGSIEAARAAWRGLADRAGVERRFWKQDEDGRWAQLA